MNRYTCYYTVENVSKNYPHSNVLYALYASAHVYMKCGNNVLGANINTMLATTIGLKGHSSEKHTASNFQMKI